jgi:hypothetical protein
MTFPLGVISDGQHGRAEITSRISLRGGKKEAELATMVLP